MPILKQLVSSSTQAKRRSRADLTAEMISAPLGDFRHTMHVGRGGDAFGDTSFLSSRSVEPPRDMPPRDVHAEQDSPKQGLLARTFRSSRRSLSSSRTDKPDNPKHTPPGGSPSYVKNAVSLPYLNDDDAGHTRGPGLYLPKSVSSSPARQLPDSSPKPANGPTPTTVWDLELTEREFGEPTELPLSSAAPRGGMKHAESVLSFHIDLGPSMLGDILSVMDRKGDTDLGYDEEPDSLKSHRLNEPAEEAEPPVRPPRQMHTPTSPYTPELHSQMTLQHPGRYCVSMSRSTEDRPQNHAPPTACVNHAPLAGRDDRDFSFMDDDDDDEIRV